MEDVILGPLVSVSRMWTPSDMPFAKLQYAEETKNIYED